MWFKGEAYVMDHKACDAVELVIQDLKPYCSSLKRSHLHFEIEFESAFAYLKVEENNLWIRVEAEELTICHGIEILIHSQLSKHISGMPNCLFWIDANEIPFATIVSYVEQNRYRSRGNDR